MDDIQELNNMPRDKSKALFILKSVDSSLGAGVTNNFYKLLDIMEESDNPDVKAIVRDIRRALVTGEYLTTMIFTYTYIYLYNM